MKVLLYHLGSGTTVVTGVPGEKPLLGGYCWTLRLKPRHKEPLAVASSTVLASPFQLVLSFYKLNILELVLYLEVEEWNYRLLVWKILEMLVKLSGCTFSPFFALFVYASLRFALLFVVFSSFFCCDFSFFFSGLFLGHAWVLRRVF